jgi:hypothetical protein
MRAIRDPSPVLGVEVDQGASPPVSFHLVPKEAHPLSLDNGSDGGGRDLIEKPAIGLKAGPLGGKDPDKTDHVKSLKRQGGPVNHPKHPDPEFPFLLGRPFSIRRRTVSAKLRRELACDRRGRRGRGH